MKLSLKRKNRRNQKLISVGGTTRYILGICIVVFIGMSVFVTIQGVATGNQLSELENKARELSEENRKLSEKLIQTSSLSDKYNVAEELGFTQPSEIIYLNGETSVASLR